MKTIAIILALLLAGIGISAAQSNAMVPQLIVLRIRVLVASIDISCE